MQLGEPEAFGMLDNHYRGVGNIDPDLYYGRGNQDVQLPGLE